MKELLKRILRRSGLFNYAAGVHNRIRSIKYLRENLPFWRKGAPDGLPLPPLQLILLVSGVPSIPWFLESGKLAAESIRSALATNGKDVAHLDTVLDFGCGCGRVLRHLISVGPDLYGTDYNPRLVEWCRKHLPGVKLETNDLAPPTSFSDSSFDMVYALSVFTHTPEDLQLEWMSELRRLLKPGGYLVLTTHGDAYLNQLTEKEKRLYGEGRIVIRNEGLEGSNRFAAYHPAEYINTTLSRGFEILKFVPAGAKGNPHQDLVLLRKSTA